jgi:hypothetical protein
MLSCSPLQLFFQEALLNVSREFLIVWIFLLPLLLSGWRCLQASIAGGAAVDAEAAAGCPDDTCCCLVVVTSGVAAVAAARAATWLVISLLRGVEPHKQLYI